MDQELYHYGTKRHSGRYPWGSGENPYQRLNRDLARRNSELKAEGLSEPERAKQLGCMKKKWNKQKGEWEMVPDTRMLRAKLSIEKNEAIKQDISMVRELKDKGYSVQAIVERTGIPDSSVRLYLKADADQKKNATLETADTLREYSKKNKYIDVGTGVQYGLGVSEERLKNSLEVLKQEGYNVYTVKQEQLGTGHYTNVRVLCPPGVTYGDLMKHRGDIKPPQNYIQDTNGLTKLGMLKPVSIDPKRIQVAYAEDGGAQRDGLIELRRNVDDLSLGKAHYAQVRIAVDGTHYIKGMALYADDLPDGIDIRVNSNKSKGTPLLVKDDKDAKQVLKPMSSDPDNPFGATIKEQDDLKMVQRMYMGKDGKEHQSALNVVNEEGNWGEWKKTLASQMLSKQPVPLAKQQLGIYYDSKKSEYEEIQSVNNPTVKKKLLESFAESCDYDAVHLQAAALPRQSSRVILPFNDLKENEIYAPSYRDGETVILIRYPHSGTFEIPELKVTNKKNTSAKRALGNAIDAVGINYKAAAQMSGADFDGDTVLVIPVKNAKGDKTVNYKASKAIKELQDFDPKIYKITDDTPVIKSKTKQVEMGKVTNLIMDMTLFGAPEEDLVKAVKHSMVVIDSEKHKLDYKQSEKDNDIAYLKQKWQDSGRASTIITRAKNQQRVDERVSYGKVDEEGRPIYRETGRTIKKKDKETGLYYDTGKLAQTKTTQMALADDAFDLVSTRRHPMEIAYATHANKLKTLANESRKEAAVIKDIPYSPTAHKAYAAEVDSLNEKLLVALKNAPRERLAQRLAKEKVNAMKAADPSLEADNDKLKKKKAQALKGAREAVGAKKQSIYIEENEWKAIQSGAITKSKLQQIIANSDETRLKELSMPKSSNTLSSAQEARIRALSRNGKTLSEIADSLGISTSTVSRVLTS